MHISWAHFWYLSCAPSAGKTSKVPCDSAAVTFLSHSLHKQSPESSWTSGWGCLPQFCTQGNLPCWPQPFQHLEDKEKNMKFVVYIISVMNTLCWKNPQSSFPDVVQLMWVSKHTYLCHITSVSLLCLKFVFIPHLSERPEKNERREVPKIRGEENHRIL